MRALLIALLCSLMVDGPLAFDGPDLSSIAARVPPQCRNPIPDNLRYPDAVKISIERCFVIPQNLASDATCEVAVAQTRDGIVTGIQVGTCTGHPRLAEYAMRAILKASPLPKSTRPFDYSPIIRMTFKPASLASSNNYDPVELPDLAIENRSTSRKALQPLSEEQKIRLAAEREELELLKERLSYLLRKYPHSQIVSANERIKSYSMAAYVVAFVEKVENAANSKYPEAMKGKYGRAVLSVTLDSSGSIQEIMIRTSSGFSEIDAALTDLIVATAPYDAFPAKLRGNLDSLHIIFPVSFGRIPALVGLNTVVPGMLRD